MAKAELESTYQSLVISRDKNMCQKCGSTNNLNAHRIIASPEYRFSIANGQTLCGLCQETER